MARLKILFTCWAGEQNIESPYSGKYSSGDKIASRIIAEGLSKKFAVHFLALSHKTENFREKGVFVHHFKNPIPAPHSKWTPDQILTHTPKFFDRYVQKIIECIFRYQIDLVMARTVHLSATGALFASEFTARPLIATLAERDFLLFFDRREYPPKVPSGFQAGQYYLNYSAKKNPGFAAFNLEHKNRIRKLFQKSSALIALSPHLISDVKKVTQKHAPSYVIPDGVGEEFFARQSSEKMRKKLGWNDRKVILCVARAAPYKRQDVLVRCFPKVLKQNPNTLLALAGTGPYDDSLVKLIRSGKLVKSVQMLGYQTHDRVCELTKAADIIALPTDSEGLPLTLLEAMACGKPIVASRVEPYTRIIKNRQNGILAWNKTDHFARALNEVLSNGRLAGGLGKSARAAARKYSWKRTIELTESVVKKILRLS